MVGWISLTEHLEQLNFLFNFFASRNNNPAQFLRLTYMFWHDMQAADVALGFTFLSQTPHIRNLWLSIMKQ